MKNLKFITALFLTSLMTLTSCQDEIDNESGDNPNTNTSNSETASNLQRTSMYDGSFDDFLDGNSCSSILLPVTATVNGTEVTIVNQADYQQVIDILAQFNTDEDTVELQFPITITLSNYTQVVVENQSTYDGFIDVCQTLTAAGDEAITCVDIDFPITLLTYSLSLEQTGSVVLETEQQLYAYISDFGDDQLFAINYPITATVDASGNQSVTFNSDAEFQAAISDCLNVQGVEEQAAEDADALETILVDGLFQVQSVINAGVDTASDFAEFTIDFANDLSVVAENTVNVAVQDVQGTYQVASQTEVFLDLTFTGNVTFNLLNQNWAVTSFNNTTISLQSTTNAALTLVLTQI
ncbi:hypothetical protein [Olleya marilimosa]|uniref:hypothetical protein n=1 Tax=Olleya marilimosa TaxID=272164 RepID=UPI00168CF2EE|nr:hypothetical protein [Olleya marilimosa]MBD3891913.1 hypothetical protein [Olleya marilimosa]